MDIQLRLNNNRMQGPYPQVGGRRHENCLGEFQRASHGARRKEGSGWLRAGVLLGVRAVLSIGIVVLLCLKVRGYP